MRCLEDHSRSISTYGMGAQDAVLKVFSLKCWFSGGRRAGLGLVGKHSSTKGNRMAKTMLDNKGYARVMGARCYK